MDIKKQAQTDASGVPTQQQLDAINALAKTTLTAEQVYVFSVRLCDDQLDRDGERFDTAALPELARLFLGKTGVVDHRWSSDWQVARIFATEVVQEGDCHYVKAWAYIRRGGAAEEIIADIEAGIKKEVSVGCSMGRSVCSICGSDYGSCGHKKGESYDGQLCFAILKEPMDAYEFSFVAVPAQPEAGVLKRFSGKRLALKALAEEFGAQEEYRTLSRQAELGRVYEKQLRDQAVRLCLSLDIGVEEPVLRALTEKAGAQDLEALCRALEGRLRQMLPGQPQLPVPGREDTSLESGFLI